MAENSSELKTKMKRGKYDMKSFQILDMFNNCKEREKQTI